MLLHLWLLVSSCNSIVGSSMRYSTTQEGSRHQGRHAVSEERPASPPLPPPSVRSTGIAMALPGVASPLPSSLAPLQ